MNGTYAYRLHLDPISDQSTQGTCRFILGVAEELTLIEISDFLVPPTISSKVVTGIFCRDSAVASAYHSLLRFVSQSHFRWGESAYKYIYIYAKNSSPLYKPNTLRFLVCIYIYIYINLVHPGSNPYTRSRGSRAYSHIPRGGGQVSSTQVNRDAVKKRKNIRAIM